MHLTHLHHLPLTAPFYFLLFVVFAVLFALVQLGILEYAYAKIGIQPRYIFVVLILSLLGAYINIPVAEIGGKEAGEDTVVSNWGFQNVYPQISERPQTVIAVNVGGALIPTILSIYLLVKNRLYWQGLIGVAVVALIVKMLARLEPGVGISIPWLIPPLLAAGVALLLSRRAAPALAYMSGSLGTLIGADLLNLANIQALGAPVVSIGGAGTFDGVFLSGILAVLLA